MPERRNDLRAAAPLSKPVRGTEVGLIRASKRRSRTVIFTIVSANYIGFAATLMQSVRTFHPDAIRVIVLADSKRAFVDIDLAAELWSCDELGLARIESMKVYYSVIEFNTALKPYAFSWLFEHFNAQSVIYIDPDIWLFSPMHEVLTGLKSHSIVLTPHVMMPLQDGKEPSDHTIMKSGIYNFGFFAARSDADAHRLLGWWADRCLEHCRVDIPGNLFTDQRWMDMAPALVNKPLILRHPGYNVAYWNLAHRHVEHGSDDTWTVNGERLVFFHFSGVVPDDPTVFSKHQNRFKASELGAVDELCARYRAAVLANRWRQYKDVSYSFNRFADGSRIEQPMRHWILRAIDRGLLPEGGLANASVSFFDQPEDEVERSGAIITRFMAQLWRDRSDLQAAFVLTSEQGRAAYLDWFLNQAAQQGVSSRTVAAAAAANGCGGLARPAPQEIKQPPWLSLARLENVDPAKSMRETLWQDVVFHIRGQRVEIPAAMALVWELRIDLQQAFPLANHQDVMTYIAWAMTDGMRQGALHAEHLTAGFVDNWTRISRMTELYADVPLTEGMIATRDVGEGRCGLGYSNRFPIDRLCRASHGLWFAYWAPNRYGWPSELVELARAYFATETKVHGLGINLTRGEVALWELRQDLQQAFPLSDDRAVSQYLFWLASSGLDEIGIPIESFDPRLIPFLAENVPNLAGVSRFVRMIYDTRPDMQRAYDLSTPEGRSGLANWGHGQLQVEYCATAFVRCIAAKPGAEPAAPPVSVGVVLTGYWTAPTGRGEDLRCTHHSLRAIGYRDYLIADLATRSFFGPDGQPASVAGPVTAGFNIVHTNADTVIADAAAIGAMCISAGRTIGYWAWELERTPSWWRHAYAYYDEIWAATRFAYDAFAAERLRPVVHIPLAVHMPEDLPAPARETFGWADSETVFLFVFDLRSFVSRKNPEAVVKAFQLAFPDPAEPARLVIKTQGGKDKPVEFEALRELCADARIDLVDAEFPRERLLVMIRSADCFVSLHRSEGFGRGPAEAMLLGKPVILTGYSGTSDFADDTCAMPVAYNLIVVKANEYPGAEGQRWADPRVDSAAEKMAIIRTDAEHMHALGIRARERIVQLFSPRTVGEKIAAHLDLKAESCLDPGDAVALRQAPSTPAEVPLPQSSLGRRGAAKGRSVTP